MLRLYQGTVQMSIVPRRSLVLDLLEVKNYILKINDTRACRMLVRGIDTVVYR